MKINIFRNIKMYKYINRVYIISRISAALILGSALYSACTDDSALPEPPSFAVLNTEETDPGMHVYHEPSEAVSDYKKAAELIRSGSVNQARLIMGRIELSNVNFEFKERVQLLRQAVRPVSWDSFKDHLSWNEYNEKPYHYRDAQIEWEGEIIQSESGSFLFQPKDATERFLLVADPELNVAVSPGPGTVRGILGGTSGEIIHLQQIL